MAPIRQFDPFHAPTARAIEGLRARQRVAVAGEITALDVARWTGGPTLEAVLGEGGGDGEGSVVLAFLGRRAVAGIEVGRRLTAAGTLVARRGRLVLMNPYVWLAVPDEVPQPALSAPWQVGHQ